MKIVHLRLESIHILVALPVSENPGESQQFERRWFNKEDSLGS